MLAAERRLYASARLQQVICISRMVQTEIHERFGLPRERLPVIYNAIDPAVVQSGPRARIARTCGRATASPHDACVFLLVGSEYARKGVGRALEALAARSGARAPRSSSAATVIRRATRRSRAAWALPHRVTFAGAQTDPRPFYGAADAFVLPTLYDALSNAVLEALACGLPVVTSDRCGAGELVPRTRPGLVCGARDIGALAAAMTALLDAGRARARRRQRARGGGRAHAGGDGGARSSRCTSGCCRPAR